MEFIHLPFLDVIKDVTSKFNKIPNKDFVKEGTFAIIDQGNNIVAGFTNDQSLITDLGVPVIVFGDHTRTLKYIDYPFAIGADGVKVLSVVNEKAYPQYVFYFLKFLKLPNAGYSRHFKFLREKKIALPQKIDDQKRIAKVLSQCEALIQKRKESIDLLDEFLQSTFLEMFGDVRAKKSKYQLEKIRPYLSAESGKSSKYVKSNKKTNFPIYGGNGINGWAIEPLYTTPIVIAGRVGQNCGIIYEVNQPCWVTDNAIVLKISDSNKLNSSYLACALSNSPILEKVRQLDLPFINQSMILELYLPIPPIDIQNNFAQVQTKIELLKNRTISSLNELENLYDSISQRAFNSELDLSKITITD